MKFHGRCCHFYWVPKTCLLWTFSHVLVKHLVKSQHLASSIPNPCPCWNSPLNDYNYHLRTKRDSVPKMDMTSERVEQWLQCCCWSLDLLLHRPAVLFILFTVGILGRCTKEYHGWNPEHLPFDLNGGPTNLKIDPLQSEHHLWPNNSILMFSIHVFLWVQIPKHHIQGHLHKTSSWWNIPTFRCY